jgi:hypothetical protein
MPLLTEIKGRSFPRVTPNDFRGSEFIEGGAYWACLSPVTSTSPLSLSRAYFHFDGRPSFPRQNSFTYRKQF